MANIPRRGTRPANALSALLSLGGKAEVSALYRVAAHGISRADFDLLVIERLNFDGMVTMDGTELQLTEAARVYLGVSKPAEAWVGKLPEPRTGSGFKPLRARSAMVIRSGAFDYRDIPSVMGDARYDFRTGEQLSDA